MSGVQVLLFTESNVEIECELDTIPEGPWWKAKPSCAVVSDSNGEFVFPALPPGEYRLVCVLLAKQTVGSVFVVSTPLHNFIWVTVSQIVCDIPQPLRDGHGFLLLLTLEQASEDSST